MNKNLKKATPLIRSIPQSGGAFYTFASAAEDMSMTFSDFNSDKRFRFSKFALLNIPNISNQAVKNTVKLNVSPSTYDSSTFIKTSDKNIHFIESFQNYCLNIESQILNNENYDCNLTKTVSERIFFKWLKELTAIRFEECKDANLEESLFTEETETENYSKIVQYLGDVSYAGNQVGNNATFTEIYINVPQTAGNFKKVLFKSVADENYKPGKLFTNVDNINPKNNEIICGRQYDTIHPDGLDVRGHFDCDEPLNNVSLTNRALGVYKKINENADFATSLEDTSAWKMNEWWYDMDSSTSNSYYCEPDQFTNCGNDYFAIYEAGDGEYGLSNRDTHARRFIRNRLDGIQIDWDVNHYNQQPENISNVKVLHEISTLDNSKDFEFNTVLLYYDIYEPIWNKTENIWDTKVVDTNLFGVLFLDNVSNLSNGDGEIKRFFKQRSNDLLNISGNEFAFKINLKIDTNVANTVITHIPVIAENNTMAMGVFHNALMEMVKISNQIEQNNLNMLALKKEINDIVALTTYIKNSNLEKTISNIQNRLSKLENLTNSDGNNTFENSYENLFNLISETKKLTNELASGVMPPKFTMDLGMIRQGNGIDIVNQNESIIISSKSNNFNYSDQSLFDTSNFGFKQSSNSNENINYFTYNLLSGSNYLQFNDSNKENYIMKNQLHIYINDKNINWVNGHLVRINISTPIVFNSGSLNIFTDFDEKLGYKTNIYTLNSSKMQQYNNTPVIEIHCSIINNKRTFFVDIF